jgi:hypothetical protein
MPGYPEENVPDASVYVVWSVPSNTGVITVEAPDPDTSIQIFPGVATVNVESVVNVPVTSFLTYTLSVEPSSSARTKYPPCDPDWIRAPTPIVY